MTSAELRDPTDSTVRYGPDDGLIDLRDHARSDPRGFLDEHRDGAILDEVQHVPQLLSWLQVEVDARADVGRFVLTGSRQFGLTQAISRSLAGRTAVLHLLPLALDELQRFDRPPDTLFETLLAGAYPRVHDRALDAQVWHAGYITTYVERDVRQLKAVGDLEAFAAFVQLAAGRTAQTVNLSSLGGDAGVSHNTARSWLSVLEASYLLHRLPPWHRNLKKRLTKAPKLHFIDSGLLCHLLGIRSVEALRHHPLRGAIFESWVVSEVLKARRNVGLSPGSSTSVTTRVWRSTSSWNCGGPSPPRRPPAGRHSARSGGSRS